MVYNGSMTYLIVTKKRGINETINTLISNLWEKDIIEKKLLVNPDFHLLDGREENSLGIEQVKDLQSEMRFKPYQEKVQIALILDAKKLTHQAQNSFLKTLEDSNDSTAYILSVGNERDMLPTIVSRSQKIYSKNEIGESLIDEKTCFESKDLIECFKIFEDISKGKKDTIKYLERYLNSLQTNLKNGIKEGTDVSKTARKISLVNTTKYQVEANGNRRLLLENLYLQIRHTV